MERSLEGIYTGPPVEMPPKKEDRNCRCSEVDEYGRHCIGLCGPDCEGRVRVESADGNPHSL